MILSCMTYDIIMYDMYDIIMYDMYDIIIYDMYDIIMYDVVYFALGKYYSHPTKFTMLTEVYNPQLANHSSPQYWALYLKVMHKVGDCHVMFIMPGGLVSCLVHTYMCALSTQSLHSSPKFHPLHLRI